MQNLLHVVEDRAPRLHVESVLVCLRLAALGRAGSPLRRRQRVARLQPTTAHINNCAAYL